MSEWYAKALLRSNLYMSVANPLRPFMQGLKGGFQVKWCALMPLPYRC